MRIVAKTEEREGLEKWVFSYDYAVPFERVLKAMSGVVPEGTEWKVTREDGTERGTVLRTERGETASSSSIGRKPLICLFREGETLFLKRA